MEKSKNSGVGFSLALSIIIVGIVLPFIFEKSTISSISSVVIVTLGIACLGIEFETFDNGKGFATIGVSFLFLTPAILLIILDTILFKIFGLCFLLIGVFGVFYGISEQIATRNPKSKNKTVTIDNTKSEGKEVLSNFKIVFFGIGAVAGFLANVVTILDYFNILN